MSTVGNQYAIALFELALEEEQLDDVKEDFEHFIESLNDESEAFFLHPKISKQDKRVLISELKLVQLFSDFLAVIIDQNRFALLKQIHQGFLKLIDEQDKIMRIDVFSGKPLSHERIELLKQQYEKKYRRQVLIENIVEPSIVAGLRFEYNGLVIDDTVNHTLNQLKSRLTR